MTGELLQPAFQAAGFTCVTVAAALGALALLRPAQDPQRVLPWTRAGFLLLSGALVAGGLGWPARPGQLWGLLCWLIFFVVLHVHRVKDFKGRTALIAGLAGWALAAGAYLGLR